MTLRDHPLMSYRGIPNWPPIWTQVTDGSTVKTVKGEIGTLASVHYNPKSWSRCYLFINYKGESYVGTLMVENHPFSGQVMALLKLHLGRPIKEIGDIDLAHML
jgi:hypothetical protein